MEEEQCDLKENHSEFADTSRKEIERNTLCNMDYTSKDGSSQTKLTCQEHVSERIVEQIVDVRVPLSKETVAVMKMAPHENTQTTQKTVEKSQPQFIKKVDDRVKTQRQIPQSK